MTTVFFTILSLLTLNAQADSGPGDSGFNHAVRRTIPDAIAVEIALRRAGIQARDASLVYARTQWQADEIGRLHQSAIIGWRQLAGPEVIDEVSAPQGQSRRLCTLLPGHDPVPGGRTLQLYRQAPPREGELDLDRETPRFILATGAENEVLITALRPGDQIQITEAVPVGGGPIQERMELQREGRSLSVTRMGDGSEICIQDAS